MPADGHQADVVEPPGNRGCLPEDPARALCAAGDDDDKPVLAQPQRPAQRAALTFRQRTCSEIGGHRQSDLRPLARCHAIGLAAAPHGGGRHDDPVDRRLTPRSVRRHQVGDHGYYRGTRPRMLASQHGRPRHHAVKRHDRGRPVGTDRVSHPAADGAEGRPAHQGQAPAPVREPPRHAPQPRGQPDAGGVQADDEPQPEGSSPPGQRIVNDRGKLTRIGAI